MEEGAVLYGWSFFMEENGFAIGQQMDLELFNGSRSVPYSGRLLGSFGGADRSFVITDQTYRSLGFAEPSCGSVWITCERGTVNQVEEALRQIMDKQYYAGLEGRVLCIGIAHDKKMCGMAWEYVEVQS